LRILLDTQALILAGQNRLPRPAARAYTARSNEVYFSLVSLWEVGIKASLGKLKFPRSITEYYDALVEEFALMPLFIQAVHIERAVNLPWHHRDPFDRLLIGQALEEGLAMIGGDSRFDSYGCRRIWD
jgi:PIN domain nuclease of toxin-antitoxin system